MAATFDDVLKLRRLTQITDATDYSDLELEVLLNAADATMESVAADLWTEKAAKLALLVDVTEGSSSRKLSQLYKQALTMASSFSEVVSTSTEPVTPRMFARSRSIERV